MIDLTPQDINLVTIVVKTSFRFKKIQDYEDAIQEGCLGLLRAAKTYDSTKGCKFATYASYRIRGAVIDFIRDKLYTANSRRHKRRLQMIEINDAILSIAESASFDENIMDMYHRGLKENIDKHTDGLTNDILTEFMIDHKQFTEIATNLNISSNTCWHQANKSLREYLINETLEDLAIA